LERIQGKKRGEEQREKIEGKNRMNRTRRDTERERAATV
jgi:hypothetical protein